MAFDWTALLQEGGLAAFVVAVVAALFVAVLFAVIRSDNKMHRQILEDQKEERHEWRQSFEHHSRVSDERQKETNEVLRELTRVIERVNDK